MKKNKAVFLDRDGTINIDKKYVYKIEDFEFIDGVIDALRELQNNGYILIIITNQSGIAHGYYTEEDYNILNAWMTHVLNKRGVKLGATYFCPHHKDGIIQRYRIKCNCRKPQVGLFEQAIKDFDIDISKSYAVGDRMRDVEVCKRYGIKGIVVNSESERIDDSGIRHITGDLGKAAEMILTDI